MLVVVARLVNERQEKEASRGKPCLLKRTLTCVCPNLIKRLSSATLLAFFECA